MNIDNFLSSRRGVYFFLFALFMATLGFRLIINEVENLGDIGMYIAISQAIDSGSVLYKNVVDTKNTGFLFFMYWIYKPYAMISPLMNYFVAYMNTILILFYMISAGMVYELLRRLTSVLSALCGTSLFILYITLVSNNLNFNQPQYALFLWLILALYICWRQEYKLWDYFIIGFLLGINVVSNSPSIVLTLIVPILLWNKGIKVKKYLTELCSKGVISFLGFLLALLPYFWYFYKYDALIDWWIWQVEFPPIYSPKSWSMLLKNLPIYTEPWSGGTTLTRVFATIPLIAAVYYLFCFIKKRAKFSVIILLLALLLGLSRLFFLSAPFSWYALYYLPFTVLVFAYAIDSIPDNKGRTFFFIFWGVWCIGALFNPIGSYITWGYDEKLAHITMKNPEKRPTTFVSARPVGFTYSTKWNYVYYNIYSYPEKKEAFRRNNDETIAKYTPETCVLSPQSWEQLDREKYPFLFEHYTQVSDSFFIRNDKISEWDLSINEDTSTKFNSFLSISDVIQDLFSRH